MNLPRTLINVFLLSAVGCVEINGGAVEVRWVMNDAQGVRIDCETAGFATVQLFLEPEDGPDGGSGSDPCPEEECLFDCALGVGNTNFSIPAGQYAMWIRPRDAVTGELLTEADGVSVPPKIVRQVSKGEVTDLAVNLIIVDRAL